MSCLLREGHGWKISNFLDIVYLMSILDFLYEFK